MSSPAAPAGGPFKLGHLVPERVPLVVTRANVLKDGPSDPETVDVIVYGFVYGSNTPGLVKAELASIHERYIEATRDEGGSFRRNPAAWHAYLREVIKTLVPGLTDDEVDVLAGEDDVGDDGPGTGLLRHLKFWRERREGGPDADPEASGEGSTTADSSPTSAPPTAAPPPPTGSASPSA